VVRRKPVLGLGLAVFALLGVTGELLLTRANGEFSLNTLATLPYWMIGALLAWRQPRNRVGWVTLAFAFLFWLTFLGSSYTIFAIDRQLPGVVIAAWAAEWSWFPALLTVFVVIPIVFPTGRPLSNRWKNVLRGTLAVSVLFVIGTTFQRRFAVNDLVAVENPLGLLPVDDIEGGVLLVAPLAFVAPMATIIRYRASSGEERQQIRWFLFAVVLCLILFVANAALEPGSLGVVGELVLVGGLGAPAVAIGVAVLRYRLYEIDRIISRTLTYALVSAALIGVYLGAVFVLGTVLPLEGELAVAGSTLLAAALFNPLRRRIQQVVDRRFNRSRFDTERTMEALSRRLSSQVDLSELGRELQQVAHQTMQPATVTVWLREEAG